MGTQGEQEMVYYSKQQDRVREVARWKWEFVRRNPDYGRDYGRLYELDSILVLKK